MHCCRVQQDIRRLAGVAFAHRSAIFAQKALSFQVLLANLMKKKKMFAFKNNNGVAYKRRWRCGIYRAVETLAVVIVVHGLDPAVASLDRETARVAFGCKQLIPI